MKSIKEFISNVFSTKSVGIFVFIFTAIALTLTLSSRYYLHHSIVENGVSKRDVIANKTITIVDTDKTQKLKNEISKKVLPILVPVQDDFIKNNLAKNLEKIDTIKMSKSSDTQKLNELITYFNLSDENAVDIPKLEYLVRISDTHFDKLSIATENTLYKILDNGISENDIQENFDSIIKRNVTRYLSSKDYDALTFLIKGVIAPNIVTDEEATEMSRKNALNAVKPVEITYKIGDKIVSAGQAVSKVQRDALKSCGYNVIQLNFSGIVGIFFLIVMSLLITAYHIEKYEPQYKRKAHYVLISFLMIIISICAAITPPNDYYILLLPVTTFAMLISLFLNPRTALFASISLLSAIALALQLGLGIDIVYLFGIFTTVYAMRSIDYTQRLELVKVGAITSIVYVCCLTGASFLDYNLHELNFVTYGRFACALLANGIISSICAIGLLPVLESMFKISTTYGLIELANTNHPLLQKLQEKAPGTHHHSQMVAILAEAAAESIGANSILTRIGSLFHDVGKLNRPLFFIENQSYYGIENPHEQFSPKFSKMVITTHPRDGVEIAKEYKISPAIYPFILEHHGDSIAAYFYNEAIKEEGEENVSKDEYRYNAPRPSSKESAIVMLADSVESAVRSLKNASFEEIDAKVHSVINGKLLDGQLSESPITLKDLKTIAATFNRVLKGMHHQRIKYHEDMEKIQDKIIKQEENENGN